MQTNPEAHFGLLRNDLSRKPAFTAMKTVLGLAADPGASFTPRPLDYSVTGGGSDLRQVLLQKSSGEYVLFLWRDVSLWDPVAQQRLSVTPENVCLHVASTAQVSLYSPTSGATPVQSSDTDQVCGALGGRAVAVTIDPPGQAAPASTSTGSMVAPASAVAPASVSADTGADSATDTTAVAPKPVARAKRGGQVKVRWGKARPASAIQAYRVQATGNSLVVLLSGRSVTPDQTGAKDDAAGLRFAVQTAAG